jgi:hypothetical protein
MAPGGFAFFSLIEAQDAAQEDQKGACPEWRDA